MEFRKKLNCIRFSYGLKENDYYSMLFEIFKDMHLEKVASENVSEIFFEKLEDYVESIRKNNPLSEYTLLIPLNINFRIGIPTLLQHNKDVDINLVKYIDFSVFFNPIKGHIESNFNEEEITLINKYNHVNNFFIRVKVWARNYTFAVKRVMQDVEINAGLYNMAIYIPYIYYTVKVRTGGKYIYEKSIGDVDVRIVYVFKSNKIQTIIFYTYEPPSRAKIINQKQLNFINQFVSDIQQFKSKKLKILIYNALAQYYNAVRTSEYSVSFLIFFNIIENLLLFGKNGTKLTYIKEWLKFISSDLETHEKDISDSIDILFEKRNLFVHESIDKITGNDRYLIEDIVEKLIIYFIHYAKKCDDIDQLLFYYQNMKKVLRDLQKKSRVLEYLKNTKSESSENDHN